MFRIRSPDHVATPPRFSAFLVTAIWLCIIWKWFVHRQSHSHKQFNAWMQVIFFQFRSISFDYFTMRTLFYNISFYGTVNFLRHGISYTIEMRWHATFFDLFIRITFIHFFRIKTNEKRKWIIKRASLWIFCKLKYSIHNAFSYRYDRMHFFVLVCSFFFFTLTPQCSQSYISTQREEFTWA